MTRTKESKQNLPEITNLNVDYLEFAFNLNFPSVTDTKYNESISIHECLLSQFERYAKHSIVAFSSSVKYS